MLLVASTIQVATHDFILKSEWNVNILVISNETENSTNASLQKVLGTSS